MAQNNHKQCVVILLHQEYHSFLLQLRDFKSSIVFPGHWGGFGGELEVKEHPEAGSRRELIEEIGYVPETLHFFQKFYVDPGIDIHVYYAQLGVSLPDLCLREGMDMGLFTQEEILSENLYSKKLEDFFPVIPPILSIFVKFFGYISKVNKA